MRTELNKDNNQPKIDVSQKVLEKIKKQKIKITDRWVFWAKKLGLNSGLILTSVVLIIIINLILYYLQQNGLVIYLSFGLPALSLVLKNLPFGFIVLAIMLLLIINYLLKKTEFIYKKYFRTLILIVFLVIIIGGIFMFYSGINQTLARKVAESDKKIFILSEIYKGQIPCLLPDRNGIVGKVIEKNINNLTIQTLDHQKEIIMTGKDNLFDNIYLGQVIGAIGTGGENIFVADKIRAVTPEMINQCLNQL